MSPAVVIVERRIKAHPEVVCSFFTDRDRWLSWQGVEAEIDPWPAGMFRMNVRGDRWAAGRFVTVDPPHHIVFTWGWEGDDSPVPPGTSTVDTGLPSPAIDLHRDGWNHYLDRLGVRAAGGDPGPDTTIL